MSYAPRRDVRGVYNAGGTHYGAGGTSSPAGGRNNSPYPARNVQQPASYSTPRGVANYPTRGPGRPPLSSYAQPPPPPQPTGPQVYHRPNAHQPGPLPYFLPPPGQSTLDPTLPPPVAQALYTTYPSRLRTGVTGLIQPETITGGPKERDLLLAELDRELAVVRSGNSGASTPGRDSPAPFRSRPSLNPTASGRRRGQVNYAEKASEDEASDDDESELSELQEAASDPEDMDYGARGTKRRTDRDRDVSIGTPSARTWGALEQQANMRAVKLKRKKDDMERGFTWLGDRVPGERVKGRVKSSTKLEIKSDELLAREAGNKELLVPITIDLDVTGTDAEPGIKIKDRFLWNVNEKLIRPATFAAILCDDLGISASYARTIEDLIKSQIDDAQGAVEVDLVDPEVTPDDVVWSEDEVEEEAVPTDIDALPIPSEMNGLSNGGNAEMERSPESEIEAKEVEFESIMNQPPEEWKEADCRIIINLDVQIYTHILRDRIEWDLSSPLPPSLFAQSYCRELGLTGEAIPLIAHAITDEILKHKKDALELDLFRKTHPEEQTKYEKVGSGHLRVTNRQGAKALVGVWRDWYEREEFGPVLVELSTEEMERREVERTREARRTMRQLNQNKRRR